MHKSSMNTPPYLKVIDGGRKARDEKRKNIAKAGILAAGIMGIGVSMSLLSQRVHQGEDTELMVGRGAVVAIHKNQQEELLSLSQKMDGMSNKELIGNLARSVDGLDTHYGVVHNMALLVLETRKAKAVPEMCDALANDPSPLVRMTVAYALGRMGQETALPALEAAAKNDDDASVKAAAEELAGKIKEKNKE